MGVFDMFYLDANFFVFALFDNTKKGENARILQNEIIEGNTLQLPLF